MVSVPRWCRRDVHTWWHPAPPPARLRGLVDTPKGRAVPAVTMSPLWWWGWEVRQMEHHSRFRDGATEAKRSADSTSNEVLEPELDLWETSGTHREMRRTQDLCVHTQQAYDWLTSVLWSTWGLVHRGSPTEPGRADTQCELVDLLEIAVPAEWACYGQPSSPLLLTSQDSVPQYLRVIINRSLGRSPYAQCVTRVLSSLSGPGVCQVSGSWTSLPWTFVGEMPLLSEDGGCGGEEWDSWLWDLLPSSGNLLTTHPVLPFLTCKEWVIKALISGVVGRTTVLMPAWMVLKCVPSEHSASVWPGLLFSKLPAEIDTLLSPHWNKWVCVDASVRQGLPQA